MSLMNHKLGHHLDLLWKRLTKSLNRPLTGIEVYDRELMGLGRFTIFTGPPGGLKSTLALQIALYFSEHYGPVIFYDQENGETLTFKRMLQNLGSLKEMEVFSNLRRLPDLEMRISALNFFYLHNVKFDDLYEYIKEAKQTFKKPILLVVDSLNKLPRVSDSEYDSINFWVRRLDDLKLEFENELHIIAIVQKKQGTFKNSDLDDMKGSSDIPHTGEEIISLQKTEEFGPISCFVNKNRDGPSHFKFFLQPVYTEQKDPRHSFCYKLDSVGELQI